LQVFGRFAVEPQCLGECLDDLFGWRGVTALFEAQVVAELMPASVAISSRRNRVSRRSRNEWSPQSCGQ